MILRMTLSEDLVEELGEAVEQVPTPMGADVVLAVVSALGPSLTIVTTRLFSPETFRVALRRWCKHSQAPVQLSARIGGSSISFEFDERTGPEMATEVSRVFAKFLATHPDGAAGSTSKTS
jgi:hypothetical protein